MAWKACMHVAPCTLEVAESFQSTRRVSCAMPRAHLAFLGPRGRAGAFCCVQAAVLVISVTLTTRAARQRTRPPPPLPPLPAGSA